jgi:molybdopterin-guanine dinucleotide biosynthesis protein A
MLLDAILPAGGLISDSFAREAGVRAKALIQLGRWTMLERTLATLKATGRIGRTVVIGPEEVTSHAAALSADAALLAGTSGAANIFRGLEWLYVANGRRYPDQVLILATDLPFLTPEAIAGFLDSCPADLDLCLPVFDRGEFERRFPRVSAPYVRFRDGEWIIGCAVLMSPTALVRNRPAIEQAFATRRRRLAMARRLGISFLVQFLLRRLTVPRVEQHCLEVLGCTGRAIRGCAAELAFDIDYVENYRYAVRRAA